jgi:hypothetical protein
MFLSLSGLFAVSFACDPFNFGGISLCNGAKLVIENCATKMSVPYCSSLKHFQFSERIVRVNCNKIRLVRD